MKPRYAELHAASAFSFLEGASLPEELAERAAELELPAIALVDTNGVYGAPRFYKAATAVGVRPLVGAEVTIHDTLTPASVPSAPPSPTGRGQGRPVGRAAGEGTVVTPPRLTLLIASQTGYRNLCKLLTAGALGRLKGQTSVTWDQLEEYSAGLYALTGGNEGLFRNVRRTNLAAIAAATQRLDQLKALFPQRLSIELQHHRRIEEEHRNRALRELAHTLKVPTVATNGVRYARASDKEILDLFTCIRTHTTLDAAGARLAAHREAYLKSAAAMAELFADHPEEIAASAELAERLAFTLGDLGYRFPDFPLPAGETAISHLRQLTWERAAQRFLVITDSVGQQLEKELAVIEKLKLAGYFLIVWDIVEYCHREKILVQGRGSAANSAVCYALSITAVDPIAMNLLFERFLSEERGEWPDIDLDLPSGEQREKVIQHLYHRYGSRSSAMTANLITYRPRSALREVAKVLGYTPKEVDRLAVCVGRLRDDELRHPWPVISKELATAGFPCDNKKIRTLLRLWQRLQGLPRHLGQHSGGMVLAGGRLDEVVPLEPASMPGRVVIQWDKEDCADLGIIKVDLLGLGMLAVLEEAIPCIEKNEGVKVDLGHLPAADAAVFHALQTADTVGVFQLESRAQMASLPRHLPHTFYDIVVQVAIIRPGPIVGGMVHTFFERHAGRLPIEYPHPLLKPILERTLGVPLFQEQLLRIAVEAAGFTGGEAEELRRAMGWKRSHERMAIVEQRLQQGMEAKGIDAPARGRILDMMRGFASYGFPESHAASFALIAYASAYLKVHHPAAFYVALLNAWPMGFYHPATLVKDAQRHGLEVFPVDIMTSDWTCRWEAPRAFRLGLRYVKGLTEKSAQQIEAARRLAPFQHPGDLTLRANLRHDEIQRLAYAGALASFKLTRRAALWQAAEIQQTLGPLLSGKAGDHLSPLPEMSPEESTVADYESLHLTTGPHLMTHHRAELDRQNVATREKLLSRPNGSRVRIAGSVIVRQHPESAKGFVFLTLEDETGMMQAIVKPALWPVYRSLILTASALIVEGILQRDAGNISVKAESLQLLVTSSRVPSHDFH